MVDRAFLCLAVEPLAVYKGSVKKGACALSVQTEKNIPTVKGREPGSKGRRTSMGGGRRESGKLDSQGGRNPEKYEKFTILQ